MLVLIVDDERPIAELLGAAVVQAGHSPMLAFDGQQALAAARSRWPDLVITDLMMPLLDGPGLIAAIRAEAVSLGRMAPPIVVMTAAGRPAAEAAGGDAILSKPFELSELERLLEELAPDQARTPAHGEETRQVLAVDGGDAAPHALNTRRKTPDSA
jgi:DNA-binding response OmpR family regulator